MLRTSNISRPRAVEDLLDARLIAQIEPLDLTSRKIFAGKLLGERRSKKRGQSVEFADHRPYVVGDDLRRIDWNIFGRLDRLFLKLFLEEEDLSLHLVLDASESSDCGEPNKFLFMQRAAMALGYVGLVNLNRVTATIFGGYMGAAPTRERAPSSSSPDDAEAPAGTFALTHAIKDLRGRRRTHDLARFLCSVRPGGSPNFTEACRRIALTRKGKGVMLVFSDFLLKEGYETGLKMLVGKGYDVILVQVLSPQEIDPTGRTRTTPSGESSTQEARGGLVGDLRLKDVEDGDMAEITISAPLLKRYKTNLAAYCNQLRDFAARREIAVMTMPSDTPIDKLVLDSLRKRGVLT